MMFSFVRKLVFIVGIFLTGHTLGLDEGPTFVSEPPPRVFFPNSKGVTLNCNVRGHPPPSVTWLTAGGMRVNPVSGVREVLNGVQNSTLKLHPFRPDQYRHDIHVTTYRCLAVNSVGSIISRPSSVQAVVMHHFEVGVSDISGQIGGSSLFTCDVPPTVARHVLVEKWMMDGRVLKPSLESEGRLWVLPSGEFVVRNLKPSDGYAHISCSANHEFDSSIKSSNVARIIITGDRMLSRPQLLLRREWTRPWEGENLLMPCLAKGHPAPTVTWYKEHDVHGKILLDATSSAKRRVRILEGQLIFKPVKREDSGFYLCVANNSAGSDSYRVEISVRSHLGVEVEPSVQRVDLNQPASLTCEVKGHPVTSVSWYKNGKQLSQMPRITVYGKVLHINQKPSE